MEKIINYFNNIESSFKRMKFLTIITICTSALVAIGAIFLSTNTVEAGRNQIYVLDNGSAVMASRTSQEGYLDLEAQDHIKRFHELMFNVSPSSESIQRNLDRALLMSDKSAYNYYMDLSERGFYQRVVSANITQEIVVDSVGVDINTYPYEAVTKGRLFLLRESNITSYAFESTCQLVQTERSPSNPHGLMIEKFTVTRNDNLGTRKRK